MIYDHFYILNKIFKLTDLPENQKSQKEKYAFLNLMILELCNSSNSKERLVDLSSHIILFLHLYKKNYNEIHLFTDSQSRSFKDIESKKV